MSKRTLFTTITPLPAGVTRKIVLDFLHDHEEMIDLNPLVKERHPIPTPAHAPADELHCQWYSLTDKISYLPGVAGDVSYTCAFNDLPNGLQTHCYAPAGLTIRDKWTVGGSLPGEPSEPVELGLKAPPTGLYLREDVDMRCNVIMTSFVKKTLKKSHAALVERLKIKAEIASSASSRANRNSNISTVSSDPTKIISSGNRGPSSISSIPYHLLSASAPTNRPPSAASSVASTASSSSIYSTESSPMWSPAPISLGSSPALSGLSPPTSRSSGYQRQPQQQSDGSVPWPFLASQPATISEPKSEPVSITVQVPEPETPFLREQQPDWPLKSQRSAPAQRPQSHLFIQAYRPLPSHSTSTDAPPSSHATSGNSSRALSDDALWQALGGGRSVAAKNAASYGANGRQQQSVSHSHFRSRSQGDGHPDYPQVGPYDDDEKDGGVVGLGVAGLRPVSMPPPLRIQPRLVPVTATLRGPFVADFQ